MKRVTVCVSTGKTGVVVSKLVDGIREVDGFLRLYKNGEKLAAFAPGFWVYYTVTMGEDE